MDRWLEIVLSLTIVGSTFAFGGVQPITYSLAEIVLLLLVLILLLRQTRRQTPSLYLPLWPVLFMLLALFQLIPLPTQIVSQLSPMRVSASRVGGFALSKSGSMTLSIYPHDTVLALIKFLFYCSGFVLAAYFFDSRKKKSTLLRTLMVLGCFEAAYGIVQYLTGWQNIFWFKKVTSLEEATGTYINPNHFAGLLELTFPILFAAVLYSFQLWSQGRQGHRSLREAAGAAGGQVVFYLFLLVVTWLAVVFSRSRGGILATIFTIVIMAFLAQLRVRRKAWMIGVSLFLICAIGYGLWIGLNPVLARFENMGGPSFLRLEPRVAIWKDSVHLVRDYPLTGMGLGTFGEGYRRYQTSLVDVFVDHAHNDYLEFAAETGVPGAALLFLPIFWLLGKMIISFLSDVSRYRSAVTLGCIGSTLALLLHSLTDFNLQIPANALIFAVVLGIAYKAVFVEPRAKERTFTVPLREAVPRNTVPV